MNKNSFLETIKAFDGEIFNISYHQQRYENVLKSFGITKYQDLSQLLNPPKNGMYRCRLLYNLENEISVSYHLYTKKHVKSLKLVYDDSLEYSKKYEQRDSINALYETREDSDDILIIEDDLVKDTSIANIAFFDGTVWLTPREPLLKGTTRQRYLNEKKIIPQDIKVSDLKKFSKIALLNAMIDFDIITDISYKY